MLHDPLVLAMLGTGFTFAATAVGAAAVFFVKKDASPTTHRAFLGFAAGVMIAASVWSLLIPAQEMAAQQGMSEWLPTTLGFLTGGVFLFPACMAPAAPPACGEDLPEGLPAHLKRTTLLVFAVTLHNLPEGMAVGLSFAMAAQGGMGAASLAGAMALALGMALQNLPEGAAISLPLQKEGMSRPRAFVYGALSGIVEPLGGLVGVLLAVTMAKVMPFMLSFAGAMIYVVVEELVPEASGEGHGHAGVIGSMLGFALMMLLDVALG